LSVVKGAKGRAVTNAEQGRPRKPITQQTVKAYFRFLVQQRIAFARALASSMTITAFSVPHSWPKKQERPQLCVCQVEWSNGSLQ
jgi:hypothetical protein